jgi:hypothetical protein
VALLLVFKYLGALVVRGALAVLPFMTYQYARRVKGVCLEYVRKVRVGAIKMPGYCNERKDLQIGRIVSRRFPRGYCTVTGFR